jgi:hypothetical protein
MSACRLSRAFFIVAVAALALQGCTSRDCTPAPAAALWVTYADSHGLGSTAHAEDFFGDLVADLGKGADAGVGTAQAKFGYSGLMIFVSPDQRGIDMGDIETLTVEYSSTGALHLTLQQEDISAGEGFRTSLRAANVPRTVGFKLDQSTFQQPPWLQQSSSLTGHRLTAIKFELLGNSAASAHLVLRNVNVEGRNVCILRRP